jgi:predicted metal-dependent hydrolase
MPVYIVGKTKIPYEIRRSDNLARRYIEVTPDQVIVTVQSEDQEDDIAGFLKRKERWLFDHTQRLKNLSQDNHKDRRFVSGVKIPYRGRRVKLLISRNSDKDIQVYYKNGFYVSLPDFVTSSIQDEVVESELRLWMKQQARKDVLGYVRKCQKLVGCSPKSIKVKDQKHMWGSCGKDGSINLNWQLVYAPKSVLEYAVLHELCHLKYRTHDKKFWSFLGSLMPDYKERKLWLENNEKSLFL